MNGTEPSAAGDQAPSSRHDDGDRPIVDLFRDLSRNTFELVRKEIQLAAVEMSQKVSKAGKDSRLVIIGAFVAYAGLLFILMAIVIALSAYLPVSLASAGVGISVLLIGLLIVHTGRKRLREEDIFPRKTIDSLKEDKKWMKDQLM